MCGSVEAIKRLKCEKCTITQANISFQQKS